MKNKKGFTLIELLAVIVILGVLLAIAIPAVSKYINTAKKSTYIINVKEYADAAKKELHLIDSEYEFPVSYGDATIISFKELESALENGGKKSSYGGEFGENYSYVMVVNDGTAEKPQYTYYIAAIDSKGYAIGVKDGTAKAQVIAYDNLSNENVVQVNDGVPHASATSSGEFKDRKGNDMTIIVTQVYGYEENEPLGR